MANVPPCAPLLRAISPVQYHFRERAGAMRDDEDDEGGLMEWFMHALHLEAPGNPKIGTNTIQ